MEVKELTAAEAYRSSSHLRLTSPQLSVNMPAAAAFSLTIPLSIFGFRFISSSQAHDKPRVGLTARDPKMIHDKGVVGSCGHEDLLFVNSRHVGYLSVVNGPCRRNMQVCRRWCWQLVEHSSVNMCAWP
jgi:hypothetical protein